MEGMKQIQQQAKNSKDAVAFWQRIEKSGIDPDKVFRIVCMDDYYHRAAGAAKFLQDAKISIYTAGGLAEQAIAIYGCLKKVMEDNQINDIIAVTRDFCGIMDKSGICKMISRLKDLIRSRNNALANIKQNKDDDDMSHFNY